MRKIFLLLSIVFGIAHTGLAQTPASGGHTPNPMYPADAPNIKGDGRGTCQVVFDASGHVATVVMTKSIGLKILDEETISFARKNWTGKPNSTVSVPIEYRRSLTPEDKRFYSQCKLPYPPYPLRARAFHYQGSGVVKVTFDESGRASNVMMKQSTRSKMLDENTIAFAQANWKSPGGKKKTIYVPVTYRLVR